MRLPFTRRPWKKQYNVGRDTTAAALADIIKRDHGLQEAGVRVYFIARIGNHPVVVPGETCVCEAARTNESSELTWHVERVERHVEQGRLQQEPEPEPEPTGMQGEACAAA